MDGVTPVVWRTDEPCPACTAGLFIIGHGEPVQFTECRLCGWCQTWDLASDGTNGNGGDAT